MEYVEHHYTSILPKVQIHERRDFDYYHTDAFFGEGPKLIFISPIPNNQNMFIQLLLKIK